MHRVCAGGKYVKTIIKSVCFAVSACVVILFGFATYISTLLPDTFLVTQGGSISIAGMPFITVASHSINEPVANITVGNSYNAQLTLGGYIPVKTVRAQVVDSRVVQVCGTPFGIKMFANGAMVVGYSDIYTTNGYQNPAKTAGLKMGDIIQSIAGYDTITNEDVSSALQKIEGSPAEVTFIRDGEEMSTVITAVKDTTTNSWRTGMWVRDSSAGIGTMTFVDPLTQSFAGLGHSIHDIDTGDTISLLKGEIVEVEITGVTVGNVGNPGELQGRFINNIPTGTIIINNDTGVYGTVNTYFEGLETPVVYAQEVELGFAQIYTTIDGQTPELYSVNIEKISLMGEDPNRNMVVEITDPRLLASTGGIVQGMSGSPILQNGNLVGAITHVLVNDPTKGYAIFAENMLETADEVA